MRYIGLLAVSLLQLAAYLLFCKGFFPTKVLLSPEDLISFKAAPPSEFREPGPVFNKVVFMVVDALRSDFMFSNNSKMEFVHGLINDGYAVGFTAYSNPPTVTLPRLKGITTGSTPNFIDAVLNIAEEDTSSTLGDQDSWIRQMKLANWRINMFGDDTWLKLFPNQFSKTDGTASFYVSDFTIVDNNVTRHLDYELGIEGRKHWDCLILHYLGLDHIGHKGGPLSSNMPGKQAEMDNIVARIFEEVVKDNDDTLFVVLGDHGMNEVGNHGGSSAGEVSPAMLFVSSKFKSLGKNKWNNGITAPIPANPDFDYFSKIDQIDLVPTLTTLLGLNIPINNLGSFIKEMLPLYTSKEDQVNVLLKNALQLKVLSDKAANKIASLDESIPNIASLEDIYHYITETKNSLSETSSDYNYTDIGYGILCYGFTAIVSLIWFLLHHKNNILPALADLALFVIYSVNFFGSSLIEEEHHLWWFFTTIFNFIVIIKALRRRQKRDLAYSMLLLVSLRILKAWNNSGQKYNLKTNMKIGTFLASLPANIGPAVMGLLLLLTFVQVTLLTVSNIKTENERFVTFMACSLLSCISLSVKFLSYLSETFDLTDENSPIPNWCTYYIEYLGVHLGTLEVNQISQQLFQLFYKVWLVVFCAILIKPFVYKKLLGYQNGSENFSNSILTVVTYFLINQTHATNIPIFNVLLMILSAFQRLISSDPNLANYAAIFTLLMQNLSFFQFGSTNSLSSVDLTNSFNGLSSYNMILSGLLTFVSNWSSPIFWTLGYLKLTLTERQSANKWDLLFERLIFNFTFYSISGLTLIASCFNLRFHLFIWTVFSPKLLYFLSWLASAQLVDFLFSSLVTALYL